MAKRHLQHIKSATANKVPAASDLLYGEIAINYAKGSESIYIKNSDNEIVPFVNKNEFEENELVVARALVDLDERVTENSETISDVAISGLKKVTYSELKTIKENGGLKPGMHYRIVDYATTTTQTDTQSAGHQFDIVLTALSENTLSENASAMAHDGDTYFEHSIITAWQLKYSLDNNTSDFSWADATNGKGVIYYMKDEYNNEAPYDFKNIMFKKYKVTDVTANFKDDKYNNVAKSLKYTNRYPFYTGSVDLQYINDTLSDAIVPYETVQGDYDYFYTFNGIKITNYAEYLALDTDEERDEFEFEYENYDLTTKFQAAGKLVREIVYENKVCICPTQYIGNSAHVLSLPGNVFYGNPNAWVASLGTSARWYSAPTQIASNVISGDCKNNVLIGSSIGNTIENASHANIIGLDGAENKIFGNVYNCVIGKYPTGNTIGAYCNALHISNECRFNSIGANSSDILIDHQTQYNECGGQNTSLIISGSMNTIGHGCSNSTFYGSKNIVGNNVTNSIIGDYVNSLPCEECTVLNRASGLYLKGSNSIQAETGVFYLELPDNSQNVKILGGAYGSGYTTPHVISDDLSGTDLKYIGKRTNNTVEIWNPTDNAR